MNPIELWLEKKTKWVKANQDSDMTLTKLLMKELEVSVDKDEESYADMINARSDEEKHEAIVKIAAARKAAEEAKEEDDEESEEKAPRAKGWLEKTYDSTIEQYLADPTQTLRDKILGLTLQLEVNRRVRFFYDLQKLRIASDLRSQGYDRIFGIKDLFIDYLTEQLTRLEKHNEKMVHRILVRSPDRAFYNYLTETYVGVGTMMAGCIISELSAPERFHSVSALWKYCGIAVVGNDPETGHGGHAQRREKGEKASWNNFMKTKLLGVLAGCMVKAQTKYQGTGDEKTLGRNVKCLNDYKNRLNTINNRIHESARVYTRRGSECFQTRSVELVEWHDQSGKPTGRKIRACDIQRRSKGHINNMSKRYMVKMFLIEILNQWRVIKGMQPLPTYDEAKLRGGVRHLG